MTRSQGGRRLEWPPRPQQEEPPAPDEPPRTRQGYFKMFLWAQQDKHGTPGRDVWTGSTGLGLAAIRRAWVSGDAAGLSQRRSGGLESAAIRRAWVSGGPAAWSPANGGPGWAADGGVISCERRARWAADGGVISRKRRGRWAADGGVISRERRARGSGNPGTREPAGGLGIATAGGGYLPRSAGMRARGQRTRLPWETNTQEQKIKLYKKRKNKTGWRSATYG